MAAVRPAVFLDISEVAATARQRQATAAVRAMGRVGDAPPGDRVGASDERATRIVEEAEAEARRRVEAACQDARQVRQEAHQEGYRAGFAEGYTAGAAAAEAESERTLADARADIEAIVAQIDEERRRMWQEAEQQIISFALEIAQKVVKDDAKVNPEIAISVIRNALRRVVDTSRIRIRVSLADIAHVRTSRETLMGLVDGLDHIEIVEDRRVGPGGCIVETNDGVIDARFETQLDELAAGLREFGAEAA